MKPLIQKKILITRDSSQAGSFKDMLEELGANVISIPTISIVDPEDWRAFDRAAEQIDSFQWIVFTSINAVTQTVKRLKQLNIQLTQPDMPKIAVVGSKTAQQVESCGWVVSFIPEKFQAEGLAEGLVNLGVSNQKVWFPRAKVARHVLIEELQKTGAEVEVTPVYENAIPYENKDLLADALSSKQVDWITFTSSSTVTNFFKILDCSPESISLPKIASIGSVTTKSLEDFSLVPEFTAEPQNLEGLCQGLVAYETG